MGILYERYHKDLHAYFYRLTRDRGRSEDLAQNVFLRMLKYSHNFKGTGKFKFWMFSIARNAWIDNYRKSNPLRKADEITANDSEFMSDSMDPAQRYERNEKHQMLHLALTLLSPEKREAIVLSRFHDMKYQDIATLSQCTENTIKSRIHRGLVELKKIIHQLEFSNHEN